MTDVDIAIRRATVDDAAGIASVMHAIVAERVHSAIETAWTVDEERRYLASLDPREVIHVAVAESGQVVGCQNLALYSPGMGAMSHVAQLGTFVLPGWRGSGIGQRLFEATRAFAASVSFHKVVIHVRGSNAAARSFYARLGFVECGRLRDHVVIDGREDDEVVMELFLDRDYMIS